jgi:sulfide:quinone oxidoreductase
MKRLVVLGGGTAGTAVSNRLRAALPRTELQITVVDQDDEHHYQPGYLFRAMGRTTSERIVRSRHRLVAPGINLVLTAVEKVDPRRRWVELADGRRIAYDILVIATGVTPRPDQIPGMDGPEFGRSIHEFYTLRGAEKLHEALRHFRGGKMVVHFTELPIKCPVAPLEIAFLLDAWLSDHGLRDKTSLTYVTPLDAVFTKPVAARELGTMLTERGISVVTDFSLESIDNDTKQLISYDDRRVDFDFLVTVPVNMGADYIARSGMGDDLNLVHCDQHTMAALDYPDVYVLGDAGTLPISKAGSVAHFSVEVFVQNFLAAWRGEEAVGRFDGHANCFVETGHGKAMLLDFNYETQPLPGTFPLPVAGPMKLLKQTRLNHLGKRAFAWVYWHMLLPGRRIPLPAAMTTAGKRLDQPTAAPQVPRAPAQPAPAPSPAGKQVGPKKVEEVLAHPIVPTF